MALRKVTQYAPDIYSSLNGILLVHKAPRVSRNDLVQRIRDRITDSLNEFEPRPLSKRMALKPVGPQGENQLIELPNLADHPLVVGPRYVPWELSMYHLRPALYYISSGLEVMVLGSANRITRRIRDTNLVNVYQVTGRFGYATNNYWFNGRVHDKCTFKHIRAPILDSALSRIQSSQTDRLFDSSKVPLSSQQAYELAKAWPSRPPHMTRWPVIYRLRCIHLQLPEFKFEVTVVNEDCHFLAKLCHEIGLLCKSSAYCEKIRRVKLGPFNIDDCLLERDLDLQSLVDHLHKGKDRPDLLQSYVREIKLASVVRTQYRSNTDLTKDCC